MAIFGKAKTGHLPTTKKVKVKHQDSSFLALYSTFLFWKCTFISPFSSLPNFPLLNLVSFLFCHQRLFRYFSTCIIPLLLVLIVLSSHPLSLPPFNRNEKMQTVPEALARSNATLLEDPLRIYMYNLDPDFNWGMLWEKGRPTVPVEGQGVFDGDICPNKSSRYWDFRGKSGKFRARMPVYAGNPLVSFLGDFENLSGLFLITIPHLSPLFPHPLIIRPFHTIHLFPNYTPTFPPFLHWFPPHSPTFSPPPDFPQFSPKSSPNSPPGPAVQCGVLSDSVSPPGPPLHQESWPAWRGPALLCALLCLPQLQQGQKEAWSWTVSPWMLSGILSLMIALLWATS